MKRKVSCGSRRAETWNHNEISILCSALKWGSSKVFSALIFTCACLKCFPGTAAGKYSPANTIIRLSCFLLIAILLTQLVRMFRVSWYSTANKGIQAFVSELLTDSTIAKTLLTFNCALCLAHLGHSWQEGTENRQTTAAICSVARDESENVWEECLPAGATAAIDKGKINYHHCDIFICQRNLLWVRA